MNLPATGGLSLHPVLDLNRFLQLFMKECSTFRVTFATVRRRAETTLLRYREDVEGKMGVTQVLSSRGITSSSLLHVRTRKALLWSLSRRVIAPAVHEGVTEEPFPSCQAARSIVGSSEALSE